MLDRAAERLSSHTLSDYKNAFRKFQTFLQVDPILCQITMADIQRFMIWLSKTRFTPAGIAPRLAKRLSAKSILNIHTGISALWTWAMHNGYADDHIVRQVSAPRPAKTAIIPFTKQDIELLLVACDRTSEYSRPGKRAASNARPTAERDKLIIRFLLDTGVRVSELCGLRVGDVDLRNHRARVLGKGSKERYVPIGKRLAKAVWRYLATRKVESSDPLFIDRAGSVPITRHAVWRLLKRAGKRAQVAHVHPHRFRHTFAISYLRNGGKEFTLMEILGHSTMEMTRRYARIAQVDIQSDHRRASPVDNWGL